jgi:hypothetical protein
MPGGVHENMKAWEPEEDRLIIQLLAELGPRWSKIVKALPGRTISSVRNRWQRIDKGQKLREEGAESKNRCQVCGEPKRGHVCFEKIRRTAAEKQAENDEGLADVLPDLSEMIPDASKAEENGAQRGAAAADDDGEDDSLDFSELVANVERKATEELMQGLAPSQQYPLSAASSSRTASATGQPSSASHSTDSSSGTHTSASPDGSTQTTPSVSPLTTDGSTAGEPPTPRDSLKRSRTGVVMRDCATMTDVYGSEPEDEDGDESGDASDAPMVPIVRRLKSGERICTELGFDPVPEEEEETPLEAHGIVPLMPSRNTSTRGVELDQEMLPPSRLPSLLSARRSFDESSAP